MLRHRSAAPAGALNPSFATRAVVAALLVASARTQGGPRHTASPPTDFVLAPQNSTVLEGESAVLRCKSSEAVRNCQWFYLEAGFDPFHSQSQPVLVTEMPPNGQTDCSIELTKTRLRQSGQWICKGYQISSSKFVVSLPAFLTVIRRHSGDDEGGSPATKHPDSEIGKESELLLSLPAEGQLVNTHLGEASSLSCLANQKLTLCAWISPDGSVITTSNENYNLSSAWAEPETANCSLHISAVVESDEGNWKCIGRARTDAKDQFGPSIHLHVLDLGPHGGDTHTSLTGILVGVSVVLLVAVAALLVYLRQRVCRGRRAPTHKYLEASASDWHSDPLAKRLPADVDPEGATAATTIGNAYAPYLDMTGSRNGLPPVPPPRSARSSVCSRASLSTAPANGMSRGSSHRSFGMLAMPDDHQLSGDDSDSNHLYEEIPADKVSYTNTTDEDEEGYMVPNPQVDKGSDGPLMTTIPMHFQPETTTDASTAATSPQKSPPYSCLGETGLVAAAATDSPAGSTPFKPATSNPTYGGGDDDRRNSDLHYDVPPKSEDLT